MIHSSAQNAFVVTQKESDKKRTSKDDKEQKRGKKAFNHSGLKKKRIIRNKRNAKKKGKERKGRDSFARCLYYKGMRKWRMRKARYCCMNLIVGGKNERKPTENVLVESVFLHLHRQKENGGFVHFQFDG